MYSSFRSCLEFLIRTIFELTCMFLLFEGCWNEIFLPQKMGWYFWKRRKDHLESEQDVIPFVWSAVGESCESLVSSLGEEKLDEVRTSTGLTNERRRSGLFFSFALVLGSRFVAVTKGHYILLKRINVGRYNAFRGMLFRLARHRRRALINEINFDPVDRSRCNRFQRAKRYHRG